LDIGEATTLVSRKQDAIGSGLGEASSASPKSSRGRKRRERILAAATELFLQNGYGATSIDSIVECSGGSKATIYSYFPTKDDLFRAVVDLIVSNRDVPDLACEGDPRGELVSFAVGRMRVVFSLRHRALLRLIIGEQERFPDIARMYYERGPLRSRERLTEYMTLLKDRGILSVQSPADSTEDFIGMIYFEWYLKALYLGEDPPTEQAMQARAERVVAEFISTHPS
jgi:TetR/AcrR family transcriptional regulator, mexJK operon transcriptional repressor